MAKLSKESRVLEAAMTNRLVIQEVHFKPKAITGRAPLHVRVLVIDSSKKGVAGALVKLVGVPFARVTGAPEAKTNSSGWATITVRPRMTLTRGSLLTLFLRARIDGQPLLAGESARRLVAVRVR